MTTRRPNGEFPAFRPDETELPVDANETTQPDHTDSDIYDEAKEIEKSYEKALKDDMHRRARSEIMREFADTSPEARIDDKEIDEMASERVRADYLRLRKESEENSGALLKEIAAMNVYNTHLERSAELNPLTEIGNKKRAEKVFAEAQKHPDFSSGKSVIVVVRMDADGFKEVNDEYGHSEGDAVLKRIADQLKSELSKLRPTDLAIHFSGDEFGLILLVNKPISKKITLEGQVESIVERTIQGIEKIQLQNKKTMSASAGFKIINQGDQTDFATSDHLADRAAALSKQCKFVSGFQKGSDRVVNADISKTAFLTKKGIDVEKFEASSLKGQIDRLVKQIFPNGVPPEATVVIEMLEKIANQDASKRRTGPIPKTNF